MTAARDRFLLVIGVGNDSRGDDGAGPAVVRALAETLPPLARAVAHDGEISGLVELLGVAETAVLIDAAVSGAAPGTVRRLDAAAAPLPPAMFACSTHALGLAEAVELARALGRLPARCIAYAIEAESFEPGAPLSPPVAAAVDETARRILEELAAEAPSHA